MGSWRVFTKRLLALPLRERPSSLFHMIANEKASFEDDDSALKLIKTCFWHQEGFSLLNNEELFAALWIVASKVHPPTANQIFTDMYKNAREKCRPIMLFWAWWANYSHLGGKKDDAVRICEKGLTLITQDRQVLEDIKNAILNGKPISLSEPSLPSTAVPLTNGVDENAAIDTSAARQQLSKLTLSDERRALDSLDVQRHEAAATGVAKPAAGSVSKNSDVVIKDDSKSDNALLSSIEKLIRQENKKTGDEIFQALEEQNRTSKAAEDQLCTMVQSFAELNSKMSEMTQKMDEMSQLIVTLRDENLQASGIPLKKKRATSEAYNDGETGVFGSSRIGFLSTVDMEDKSAKKEVVKAAAPALHNGIPADCDMSLTRCDLATNSAEPARQGAPGGIDPLMDPENAAGFIQQRWLRTGTSANLGSALRHPQSLSTPETTNRNSASSNSRATTGYGKQQCLIPRDSEEVTPEPSPAIAARKPMDRMPRDSVCVRAHQNQRHGSNSLRNRVSDGLSLPPAHSIQTSTPFEKCADQPPTLNMSIIAPRGFSCSPINEEEDEPLDSKKNAVGPSGSLVPEPITSYTSGATGTSGSGGVGGSKPTEETNRSSNSSKMKPPRFMNLDHIKNPFSDEAIDTFFQKSEMSPSQLLKYHRVNRDVPDWIPGKQINCGLDTSFMACESVDRGKFGHVFKLRDEDGTVFAAKVQKPPFPWEYYILRLLHDRLEKLNLAFRINLNIQEPRAFYCFNDAGILVSKYYSAPTMLNFHNHLAKERKCLSECEIVILLLEFISILQTVHKCEILHGDLKPDNVIMRVPEVVPRNKKEFFTGELCFLVLIDFGRSVDMQMFAKNHKFLCQDGASSFTCTQMLEGKPWSYELDFFCMAACFHMLIFGKYMKNFFKEKTTGQYRLIETPKRNFNRELWSQFFNVALNDNYSTALLPTWRDNFLDYLYSKYDDTSINESYHNIKRLILQM